ncbi:peptidoglycan DD-metalloendopeptidase family protein [Buchnera aphidicola]|uniref:peptidoglycan DD-metalloendopeptidase family protein n=1 Tax=Buchnera aphidicola TaxID=9 RepID=UPI00130DEFC3|nr:peptidoglycan DD-metalloendopeptidase family protein [Buchnera aphidicola]
MFVTCNKFSYINYSREINSKNINNKYFQNNKLLNDCDVNNNFDQIFFFIKNYSCDSINNHIFLNNFKNSYSINCIIYKSCLYNNFKRKNKFCHELLIYNTSEYLDKKPDFYTKKYCNITIMLNKNFIKTITSWGININEIKNVIDNVKNLIYFYKLDVNIPLNLLIKRSLLHEKVYKNTIVGFKIYYNCVYYYGILEKNGKFYDNKGYSLITQFLRFPFLKKYRVSSNFNLHRLNPITNKISPHQGIDYAMPIGTPILSIGDGKVIKTKSSTAAGKYIIIRHNIQCITKYMHLKKILVKVGEKVKKGDQIGLSGNTGYSTGPHLHYEVWVNNKVINPNKLVLFEKLSGKKLKIHLNFLKKIMYYFI